MIFLALTCYEVSKVPAIVMVDGLEILDELLYHRLLHHAVLAPELGPQHHLAAALRPKLLQEPSLQHGPDSEREIEDCGLKCSPL